MDKLFKAFAQMIAERLDPLKVELQGVEKVTIQGKDGADGRNGTDGKDGKDSLIPGPIGPEGPPGRPGYDGKPGKDGIGRDGIDGKNGKDGKNGSPDTGEDIIKKINADKSGKLIKASHVEGFKAMEERVRTAEANSAGMSRGGGSFVYDFDYSSLLDGVKKTFTLPQNAHILLLLGSSDQGFFRKNVDYTFTASTFTFTAAIDETTVLSQGQTLTLIYKIL